LFGHIILADEVNRTSPRTQSALLESMNERQITVDGTTYPLERPFFVVATENHLSAAGTFPLPDSQLDRFLLSFEMPAPGVPTQAMILALHADGDPTARIRPVLSREAVVQSQDEVRNVHVSKSVIEYIVRLCEGVRSCKEFVSGTSSRASIAIMQAARAQAYLEGRHSVYPEDVKRIMPYCLRHRLSLRVGIGATTSQVEGLLRDILDETSVPTLA
jgi:MoxR-like ATPase